MKKAKKAKPYRMTVVDTVAGEAHEVVLGEDGKYAPMLGTYPAKPLFIDDVE